MIRETSHDLTDRQRRRPYGAVLLACVLTLLAFPLSSWGLDGYCRVTMTYSSATCSAVTTEILVALFLFSLPMAFICLVALIAMLVWPRQR